MKQKALAVLLCRVTLTNTAHYFTAETFGNGGGIITFAAYKSNTADHHRPHVGRFYQEVDAYLHNKPFPAAFAALEDRMA